MSQTQSNPQEPLVIAVILHWNRYQETKDCLETMMDVTYSRFHILVVDNGSTDDSVQRLSSEFPKVEFVLNGANFGFSKGNNMGIRSALELGADYVLVINNDTLVAPNFLEPMMAAAQADSKAGALSCSIYTYTLPGPERTRQIFYVGGKMSSLRGKGSRYRRDQIDDLPNDRPAERVSCFSGCCILIKRQVLEKLGLFDEDFFFGVEDHDYSWRLNKAGYHILYVPQSIIWHKKSSSRSYSAGELYNGIVSQAILMRKHYPTVLFLLWWSLYTARTHLLMGRLVGSLAKKHGLSAQRVAELRVAIRTGLRHGFSAHVKSGFIIPNK